MCSGSKPKASTQAAIVTPAPPPAPPAVAELDVDMDKNPDSTSSKTAKQKSGRSSLRVQRQAGVGGESLGAGLAIPKG